MSIETQVKEYKNPKAFDSDASRMLKNGWNVVSTTERTQHQGCLDKMLLGWWYRIFVPIRPTIVVTYRKGGTPTGF